MGNQRRHIRCKIVLSHADAENQRACQLHGNQLAGAVHAHHAEAVGAFQPGHGFHHRLLQVPLIVKVQQVYHHFRVGLAVKDEALGRQLLPQLRIILDDAVMHHRKAAVVGHMGMGVFRGRCAVGGPAGMADAADTLHRAAVLRQAIEIFQPAAGLGGIDPVSLLHGNTGGVIAPVLHALQALQQNRRRLLFACKSDNSAHQAFLL